MSHEVYICYDETDRKYSDAVCQIFDDNNIEYWVKSRDFTPGYSVDSIITAITEAKCFVLIFSENSKDTNFVITETDIAFSRNIPIIILNIDDSKIKGNLEFILETQTKINSFPNSKNQLETLVRKTSEIISKPIDSVKIDTASARIFEKENTIKKYIKIAIPIVIALVIIYFVVIVPTGQKTTSDGIFAMNITQVDVSESDGNFKYIVRGESYNMPSDSERYFMNIKFFDKTDNMVYEINSTADEFKSGIICTGNLKNNNVTHIGFKLTDINNKVLSTQNYTME